MKPLLLFAFCCLQTISIAQITFEEITCPEDFSLSAVRKSPIGEYFVQASNDKSGIYTSMNGHDWTRSNLPLNETLSDIQFFSDGTPLLKPEYNDHLIRRNGTWYNMEVPGAWGEVEASFIKDDTLFVFQDDIFSYSLNKGQSFITLFAPAGLFTHTADIWKIHNHMILHYTVGATDYLTVYNQHGARVFDQTLDFGSYDLAYNSCGEVLFMDYDTYFLFKEQGLILESGSMKDIFPDISSNDEIFAQDDHYYLKKGKDIFRTIDCEFTWELAASNDVIEAYDEVWISQQEDIFLYDVRRDYFIEQASGSNVWGEHLLEIDYAHLYSIDESTRGDQIALTSNALFNKNLEHPAWAELDSVGEYNYQIQYSPDGDLYVCRKTDILYSKDNGNSFSTIQVPDDPLHFDSYSLEVLDDDKLFLITDSGIGDCYYTLNNGQTWIPVDVSFSLDYPVVKLVDNYILVAELNYQHVVTRINIATNVVTTAWLGDFYSFEYYGSTVLDDGTMYFQGMEYNGTNPEGLYRYRIGKGLEFLGQFEPLAYVNSLETSGNDLYAFADDGYYLLNGESLEEHPYIGLPITSASTFMISDNQYVYALIGSHRIFRSTKPLSYPHHITGSIFHDANEDCAADISDAPLNYWQVKVEGDQYLRIKTSDSEGHFNFSVPKGAYTLSSVPINANWDICQPTISIAIDENNTAAHQDFRAVGLRDCADLTLDFSTPLLRRCFENYYSVRVRNTGPEASDGTTLTLKLDPFFEFSSATIPYTLVGDSIVKFDLGVLAVNEEITFKIFFKLSCDVAIGTEHCLEGFLQDDNICGGERSTYIECQENIGSYDPNDKRVFNQDGEEAERIDKGEYIYYHIRFQNTGTDTAFNIRVVDPLSPKLDLSTLEMLSASQSYEYFISDGPELVVLFDNVLLPDSAINEPASHGFFKFRVKPLPEFDYGTSIPNKAEIYFDFNDAVVTNEATMFILPPLATKETNDLVEFNVFPNPTSGLLYLTVSDSDRNRIDAYEIIDHLGRRIQQSKFFNTNVLNVAHLTPGVYNLMLMEKGNMIGVKNFVRF